TTAKQWEELSANSEALDRLFERLAVEELRYWLEWARKRIGANRVRLLVGLGNDDFTPMEEVIAADSLAELTDRDILVLDDRREVLTIPYSNPTPWKTHRELPEVEIGRLIDELADRLQRPDSAIYNIHVPPYNTPLDLAPRLDRALTKVITPGGEAELVHVGSTAVRSGLERRQPLLALHGHIHESRGTTRFGRTLSVNSGSAYSEGALLGALVDLEGTAIRSSILTSG
ncbi:MAG: metallophosphoesterase, partial [Thermoplasmata archaeon]